MFKKFSENCNKLFSCRPLITQADNLHAMQMHHFVQSAHRNRCNRHRVMHRIHEQFDVLLSPHAFWVFVFSVGEVAHLVADDVVHRLLVRSNATISSIDIRRCVVFLEVAADKLLLVFFSVFKENCRKKRQKNKFNFQMKSNLQRFVRIFVGWCSVMDLKN